jgi:flavin reductase (DIM6/NTAB) family NADH-FMN oxidoreductase RutF
VECDIAGKSTNEWYHFLTAAVAPRPIAWVTTLNSDGTVNLAPFSWFQSVSTNPPRFMLALADKTGGAEKDTLRNAKRTSELVIHVVRPDDAQIMVNSSAAIEGSEVSALGLETTPSSIDTPRLVGPPVAFDCVLESTTRFEGEGGTTMLIARATHIWAEDSALDAKGNYAGDLLARMGGKQYTTTAQRQEFRSEL